MSTRLKFDVHACYLVSGNLIVSVGTENGDHWIAYVGVKERKRMFGSASLLVDSETGQTSTYLSKEMFDYEDRDNTQTTANTTRNSSYTQRIPFKKSTPRIITPGLQQISTT